MRPILHYYDISPDVVAFSTTRQGGCSTDNYASFNINRYCGDNEEHIARNREALCQLLNISDDRLVMPHQTHETRVAHIDEQFMSLSAEEQQAALEGFDALMTNLEGICIGVSTADCIPILLYDPQHRAVCAVHAGWRGTVKRIVEKTIAAMTETYGSRPADLIAQICPGISLDSFEVGDEVYDAFAAAGFEMKIIGKRYPTDNSGSKFFTPFPSKARLPVAFHSSLFTTEGFFTLHSSLFTSKWHIDLPKCNRQQLMACGIPSDHICLSNICTYKDCEQFFSARRLGIHSGRIFTGIMLKNL